jgi:hypothetical protein
VAGGHGAGDSGPARARLAFALGGTQEYGAHVEAEEHCRLAVQLAPGYAAAWNNLGTYAPVGGTPTPSTPSFATPGPGERGAAPMPRAPPPRSAPDPASGTAAGRSEASVLSRVPLRWMSAVLGAVVVATAVGLFLPALSAEFVNWDDPANFIENTHYRGLGPRQLTWMFTTFHMGHYMPLTWLTLGWDYAVWGMSAWGYRLTNLLLHAATALTFYFLSLRLLRLSLGPATRPLQLHLGAAVAAIVFAAHPLRAESVAWVTERRDVLSGLFYVGALLAYVKAVEDGKRRVDLYWTAVALFVGALLSKSITATLPVVSSSSTSIPCAGSAAGGAGRAGTSGPRSCRSSSWGSPRLRSHSSPMPRSVTCARSTP